jgi:hypothetical protein
MASSGQPHRALQLIFAFFLGLMITSFFGVGVYTFYPPRIEPFNETTRALHDEKQLLFEGRGVEGLTEDQKAEVEALNAKIHETGEQLREHQEAWTRTSSIILLLLATLAMGVSLVRADQLPVINNGLLLGGIFTMLYGTGWILASGESQLRFWTMGFALLVTLALGYVRFVRGRAAATPAGRSAAGGVDSELTARVEALEHKLNAAADAMKREG